MQPPGRAWGLLPAEPRVSVPWEPRADPQVGRALHEQCFTSPAGARAADRDLLPHSHGTSPRPGNVTQSPTVASSPRPLIQTLIISAYISLQTTSCLYSFFSALIPRRDADSASPQLPPAGRGSAAGAAEPPQERSASPGHRRASPAVPQGTRGCPTGTTLAGCPESCCKGKGELHQPKSAGRAFIAWGAVYIPRRAALQGKVHPRWECFTGEVIYSLQGR